MNPTPQAPTCNPVTRSGILLVDKPAGKTSFDMVAQVRRRLRVQKVGHAGTLDPFATGLLILLVGREYTRFSDRFLQCDKEYLCEVRLGEATDTHDTEGKVIFSSDYVPTLEEVEEGLSRFQGEVEQVPPMFSAKKINGQKLYHLARKGQTVERQPVTIRLETTLIEYAYPLLSLSVKCSKGAYMRVLADDLGKLLGCGAHLQALKRTQCGALSVEQAVDGSRLMDPDLELSSLLLRNACVSSV